jgi:hypothetical protein
MRIQLCGVRGSTPAPGPDFVRYGGNTSSVALTSDGGLAPSLMLDQAGGESALDVLSRCMSPSHFPIGPRLLRGGWTFGMLPVGELRAGPFTILALEIPHKGGRTYGYRVSDGRSELAYVPDHCPTSLGPGPDGLGEYHDAAVAVAARADALIRDASLLPDEVPAQASFGHSAADYAGGLAARAGSRRVVLFQHGPDRTDTELDKRPGASPGPVCPSSWPPSRRC